MIKAAPKIYLAGRVSKHDWRHSVGVDDFGRFCDGGDIPRLYGEGFPVVPSVFEGTDYLYTGPWFIRCDHGCGHGPTSHGVALHDNTCINPNLPDGWSEGTTRRALAALCCRAIDASQVVVAWIEKEAYGTIAEIGYAHARGGKLIVVGGPESHVQSDLWFASSLCGQVYSIEECPTPVDLFRRVLGIVARVEDRVCESPVEVKLMQAFKGLGFNFKMVNGKAAAVRDDIGIMAQYEAGKYRLDFAVMKNGGASIDVEVDGHEFHERTKEQASRDKERDRYMQRSGWKVFRFTGSDVHRNAMKCASEVIEAAMGT